MAKKKKAPKTPDERGAACQAAVERALKKYRCQLIARGMITPEGRIQLFTSIIPLE
jgi:hypothetical protein